MKNLRFFLIPLLFICGVLLLSLLLRWIASPNSEETLTDFQTQAEAPAYTRWHLPEGATLRLGKGHIRDIKFVPDGTQFIVAASTGIWLYDVQTGAEIAQLNEKPRNIKTIAFSPDGKTLTSSDSEGEVQMWDTSTTKRRSTFQGPQKITDAVSAISGDEIKLANEQHGIISLWEFRTNTPQPVFTDLNSDPRLGHSAVMALSPDATHLAAASLEEYEIYPLRVWNTNTKELLFTLEGHTRRIQALVFSPDSKTLASGDIGNTIRLWDMDTQTPRATFKISEGGFHTLTLSPNGKLLASGSNDGRVRLWDATVKKQAGWSTFGKYVPTLTLRGHKNRVSALAFSPDGKTLITGSYGGSIRAWDTTIGSKRFTSLGHFGNALGLVFPETGSTLTSVHLTPNWSGVQLKNWDVSTGNQLSIHFLHTNGAFGTISPDGKTIITDDYWEHNITQLWDVKAKRVRTALKGRPKKRKPMRTSFRAGFTFSPDGTTVASGGQDNVVRLWDTTARQPSGLKKFFGVFTDNRSPRLTIQGHTVHVRTLAFSPDGKMLAGGSNDSTVYLWDAHTGTKFSTFMAHTDRISALAFSPDGKTLASGSQSGEICLWDTVNETKDSANIITPRATVSKLLFSPDGKILVSGNGKGTIQLWDVHTGKLLSTHIGHTYPIRVMLFSSDGKTLASGSNDGTILLWDWEKLK